MSRKAKRKKMVTIEEGKNHSLAPLARTQITEQLQPLEGRSQLEEATEIGLI